MKKSAMLLGVSLFSVPFSYCMSERDAEYLFFLNMVKLAGEKNAQYKTVAQKFVENKEMTQALKDFVAGYEGLKKLCQGLITLVERLKQDPELAALVKQELIQAWLSNAGRIELSDEMRKKVGQCGALDEQDCLVIIDELLVAQAKKGVNLAARLTLFSYAVTEALEEVSKKEGGQLTQLADGLAPMAQEAKERRIGLLGMAENGAQDAQEAVSECIVVSAIPAVTVAAPAVPVAVPVAKTMSELTKEKKN